MEKIIEYIKLNNLTAYCKKRTVTYQRYFLYNLLYEHGLNYHEIGEIFGREHSTIIHGVKAHQYYEMIQDALYFEYTDKLRIAFKKPELTFDLATDVMKCSSLKKLELIKLRIRCNFYENVNLKIENYDTKSE